MTAAVAAGIVIQPLFLQHSPMTNDELLPGVTSTDCPPRIACDAHATIRRARQRVVVRQMLQISLVFGVDYLFVHWSGSRFPFLDRGQSMTFLRGVNLVIVVELWLSRALPKWWARRIAETWSRRERERFKG
jgi:hypothetical protein